MTAARSQKRGIRKIPNAALQVGTVLVFLAWTLVPIIWLVMTALKQNIDILTFPPKLTFVPTLDNFGRVLGRGDFQLWFRNSLVVAFGTTAVSLLVGGLAAYGLSRYRFRGKATILGLTLGTRMIPPIILVVPMFFVVNQLGLHGSLFAVVLAHTTFNLPLVIWMMKTFIDDVPVELEEAAAIDGSSLISTIWRITLPLAAPGIAATTVLTTILSWNEYLFALVFTGGGTRTLPVGIAGFMGDLVLDFGAVASAATIIMVPMIILGLLVQRHLIQGMSMGGVKG